MSIPVEIVESELNEEYIRPASGPGGQHVNRTANSVRLSFHFMNSKALNENTKFRLAAMSSANINGDEIVIVAKEYRSLQANREAARKRLFALLETASKEPRKRKPTQATKASKERRLAKKAQHSTIKAMRGKIKDEE